MIIFYYFGIYLAELLCIDFDHVNYNYICIMLKCVHVSDFWRMTELSEGDDQFYIQLKLLRYKNS